MAAAGEDAAQGVGAVAQPGFSRQPAPLQFAHQRTGNPRQGLDMLVAIDKIGRAAPARLERVELRGDFRANLSLGQTIEKGGFQNRAQRRKSPPWREGRHRRERRAKRQIEMQTDLHAIRWQIPRRGEP